MVRSCNHTFPGAWPSGTVLSLQPSPSPLPHHTFRDIDAYKSLLMLPRSPLRGTELPRMVHR